MAEDSRATEAAKGAVLGADAAQLLAWLTLALENQVVAALALPGTSTQTSWLHHLYDLGQLLGLGALSWAAVRAARWLAARFRPAAFDRLLAQAGCLAAVVFVVGLATVGGDVSNLAERYDTPRWQLILGFALVFGLALGSTRLLRALASRWLAWVLAAAGLVLAAANALTLPRDYFACHLMAAWLAAQLLAVALEGATLPRLTPRHLLGLELAAAGLGLLSIAWRPPVDVRLRLYSLPSSVLQPFVARLLPDEAASSQLVSARVKASPWYKSRDGLPDVPATGALEPSKPPIVMFFTIDAFRAEVMADADNRKKLPTFTRLRRESSYFTFAHSPTASTMSTMASVFSGKYFSQLHWGPDKKAPLIEKTPRFPELLSQHGVRTLLLGPTLGRVYGSSGVARGFAKEVVIPQKDKPATHVVDAIIAELEASQRAPFFIYSHFIEPHAPYDLAGKKGSPYQRYLREVALVDKELGRLRAYLEEKGLADRTYFIISADHGEGFGEHGTYNHARTAYEELVHVPFFFYAPGRPGRDIDTPVSGMDVGPTVLDLFGLPTPGFWMGQSLLPVVAGQTSKLERPIVIDTGGHIQALYLASGHKVIFTRLQRTTEVYDLKRDPQELTNLVGQPDRAVTSAIEVGEYFFNAIKPREADFESPEMKF